MRRDHLTALLSATSLLAAAALSCAQDTGQPTAPAAPAVPVAPPQDTRASDPEALRILAVAAARQGGDTLAADGALQSFHIEFGRVKVRRTVQQEDGTTVSGTDEATALEIDWMRNEDKPSSLKTFWELNGQRVTRAVIGTRGYFWLYDGQDVTQLAEGTHDADREEVLLHRRLSETLIDVAVLQKLLHDGSIWTRSEDATYEGVALRREPLPGTTGLHFTLWLDPKTQDPRHVRVDPVEEGAPCMHYDLTYVDGLPKVEGAKLRFPQEVVVRETKDVAAKPGEESMHLWIRRVVFNGVQASDFYPPKREQR